LWNLHFNDNKAAFPWGHDHYDKLHIIKPIINSLSPKSLALYNPHKENSIDKAIVIPQTIHAQEANQTTQEIVNIKTVRTIDH